MSALLWFPLSFYIWVSAEILFLFRSRKQISKEKLFLWTTSSEIHITLLEQTTSKSVNVRFYYETKHYLIFFNWEKNIELIVFSYISVLDLKRRLIVNIYWTNKNAHFIIWCLRYQLFFMIHVSILFEQKETCVCFYSVNMN